MSDRFVALLRHANHIGRHLTPKEAEEVAVHIEHLSSARLQEEERALRFGFEGGWKSRVEERGVAFNSIEYGNLQDRTVREFLAKRHIPPSTADRAPHAYVCVLHRNVCGVCGLDGEAAVHNLEAADKVDASPSTSDPRKDPHEYVTVENHQGCGVCGFGIGAVVHNLHAAGWRRKEHGERVPRPGEKVLQFEQVLSLALRARLDRIALTEFVLVHPLGVAPGEQDAVRLWYDPIAETVLRELPVDSSAGLWFVAKLPKAEP